tara:strand:+ start:366 stop:563 length:198 start_codon:yes stop_codon:yes gene_type:complete
MKKFVSYSKCDSCSWEGAGVALPNNSGEVILFECLLCAPKLFEEAHLENKERKSCLSQDEKSPII